MERLYSPMRLRATTQGRQQAHTARWRRYSLREYASPYSVIITAPATIQTIPNI